jgi:2,4-dienoyl-CoA reductase-like NADH-dependent reductase (Old Yellow Enzyme family)
MKLFEPLNINGMVIPNRVMVPAMVTHLCREDGTVNDEIINRYTAYAEGGVGLIVVEAMAIHANKSGTLLRISEDQFVPGLSELTKRIHGCSESKLVPQIIHFMKVAKTGWRQTIDALSIAQIEEIIEQFGRAAARAREAGFDGLELHSAHAYTLSSFLSRTNPRTDEYGGTTVEGRLRLIGKVMQSVRRHVGKDFPVCVRFNAEEFIKNGYTVDESKLIAQRFAELGFDYISLSVGGKFEDAVHTPGQVLFPYSGYSGDRCMPGIWLPRALHVHLAAEIKAHLMAQGLKTPIAIAGTLSDPEDAARLGIG